MITDQQVKSPTLLFYVVRVVRPKQATLQDERTILVAFVQLLRQFASSHVALRRLYDGESDSGVSFGSNLEWNNPATGE